MADSCTSHHSRIQPYGHHHLRHCESSRSATKTNHAAATTLGLHDATTTTDPFITALVADLHQFISRDSFTAASRQQHLHWRTKAANHHCCSFTASLHA
ncbi:hypothetical protein DEO72_LG7g1485 [Vigna unguiculata]|uniref:Uncharacterized protein n=1 Tax=Vigna unguiculata TaxID=3917 RepID=A0A4D6MGR3_VIGUN|nr:hypothetical protein DEO72_LG7g1485 [Vigna unguiculata]